MYTRIKLLFFIGIPFFLLVNSGCKKGTFDINSPNPNVPSIVPSKYILSAALAGSALLQYGAGNTDILNTYMGYLSISGGFIPNAAWLTYNVTSDFGSNNWDAGYPVLENYIFIANTAAKDSTQANFLAIAKIMMAYHFSRLVDIYNDIPYTSALQGSSGDLFPTYDKAADVYTALLHQLDTAVTIINNNPGAVNPGTQDIMFDGHMNLWIQFANTVKLRMLMNLTQTAGGPATIQSELAGLTTADFIGAGEDAIINPGYTNASTTQQNPLWGNFGWGPTGSPYINETYLVACSYIVNFWKNTNDSFRPTQVFCLNTNNNVVQGRAFGSNNGSEISPSVISLVGYAADPSNYTSGILVSPTAGALLFPAFESLFLQAEAAQRGYLTGSDPVALYQSAISENFRVLSIPNYATAATTYYSQTGSVANQVNISASSDPITTIITQKWASLILFDPLESWCDWRRLGIPASLPVSIFPGTTATHIPYRLLYPTSEYKYNSASVAKEGTINALTSKIFWMP
ncbi:MAG TPA: SusD/RagB family nutrient-binding outer membrane lipoprotein [Puia sp.]|nr:SusD/RagB family nutrient-binding outer membrane lipoprotein [Puia sp.]